MKPTRRANGPQATILVVDDDRSILLVLEARLASAGYRVITAGTAEEALSRLLTHPVDLIISDLKMPGMGGKGLLQEVLWQWPATPIILLTAYGTIPDAVATIQKGAADYLTKPFDGEVLLQKVAKILAGRTPIPERSEESTDLSRILWGGRGPAMRELYDLITRVARAEVSVLIVGESGTGKEMIARIIHERSARAKGPFIIVDCGSTPASLLESELFGHVKGSFTHALRDKAGLIEEADGGTLFLDEIGNISQEMQTRLLRFLQERTIRRIGDTKEFPVNCRVLAATHADLPILVREGAFRQDLYFRLKVVTIKVPALRERKEDIPLLAERFVAAYCAALGRPIISVPPETMARLQAHDWPGNVRELQHAIEAGVVLCSGDRLEPDDLQIDSLEEIDRPVARITTDSGPLSLEENEHQAILRALERSNWVQKDAADLLGISRRAIHYKIKKYAIRIPGRSLK